MTTLMKYENDQKTQKDFHISFCSAFGTERGFFMLSMKTPVREFLFDCQVRNLTPRTIHNYEMQLT